MTNHANTEIVNAGHVVKGDLVQLGGYFRMVRSTVRSHGLRVTLVCSGDYRSTMVATDLVQIAAR